jgi:hypothetical protein
MSATLRFEIAREAWEEAADFDKPEEKAYVDNDMFERCLSDMPEHHKATARKRGFIRANAEPGFREREDGLLYTHGIVNIINQDAEINQIRTVHTNDEFVLQNILKNLSNERVRLISITTRLGTYAITFTKQRYIFD